MTSNLPTGTAKLPPRRVLIVDDDPEIQQLVRVLINRMGFESEAVGDASEAAYVLQNAPQPDLLILDMMLPDISGMDFLRQLRSYPEFDRLPVLILSALIDPAQIREALDAGADRYLTKPYIAKNLTSVVLEILRTGRRPRA